MWQRGGDEGKTGKLTLICPERGVLGARGTSDRMGTQNSALRAIIEQNGRL